MAEASLALAERRAGDLKVATEKLGGAPITNRQLWTLRIMGIVMPPPSAGVARRIGGVLLLLLAIVALVFLGFGIVNLVALPFGGIGAVAWFWGVLLIAVALAGLGFYGRRRQKAARARASEQRAAALGGRR
jgi:hypothetical protein